jgi:hypothetical protein
MIEGPLSAEQDACLGRLRAMNRRELILLFRPLQPPSMRTFEGEFDSELLHQGSPTSNRLTRAIFALGGLWTGKAFSSVSDTEGVGYNCFRDQNEARFKLPMRTEIAPSRLEHGRSLIIDYSTMNRGMIRFLKGEVRQLSPTVMLGFGTFGPKIGERDRWRRKIPFVMIGPRRDYQISAFRTALKQQAHLEPVS